MLAAWAGVSAWLAFTNSLREMEKEALCGDWELALHSQANSLTLCRRVMLPAMPK
jgi:hypothetical protein